MHKYLHIPRLCLTGNYLDFSIKDHFGVEGLYHLLEELIRMYVEKKAVDDAMRLVNVMISRKDLGLNDKVGIRT